MADVYTLHPRAALREVAGEMFVVTDDRAFHHAHTPTALDVLDALRKGPTTADELAAGLCSRFAVDAPTAQADVDRFLGILVERLVAVRQAGDR